LRIKQIEAVLDWSSGVMLDTEREIGRLQAEVASLREAVRELRDDVHTLNELLQQGRGAWRLLGALIAFASAVSGLTGVAATKLWWM
jgi:uncharacterized protein YlxW (UPF0749 family)